MTRPFDRFVGALHRDQGRELVLETGRPIIVRVGSEDRVLLPQEIKTEQIENLVREVTPPDCRRIYEDTGEVSFPYAAPTGPVLVHLARAGAARVALTIQPHRKLDKESARPPTAVRGTPLADTQDTRARGHEGSFARRLGTPLERVPEPRPPSGPHVVRAAEPLRPASPRAITDELAAYVESVQARPLELTLETLAPPPTAELEALERAAAPLRVRAEPVRAELTRAAAEPRAEGPRGETTRVDLPRLERIDAPRVESHRFDAGPSRVNPAPPRAEPMPAYAPRAEVAAAHAPQPSPRADVVPPAPHVLAAETLASGYAPQSPGSGAHAFVAAPSTAGGYAMGVVGYPSGPHATAAGVVGYPSGPHATAAGVVGYPSGPHATASGVVGYPSGPHATASGGFAPGGSAAAPVFAAAGPAAFAAQPRAPVAAPAPLATPEPSRAPRLSVIPGGRDEAPSNGPKAIDGLLHALVGAKGSDLHLTAGLVPMMRKDGEIQPVPGFGQRLESADIERMLLDLAAAKSVDKFRRTNDADYAYELEGAARFRVNCFRDRRGVGGVLRVIPSKVLTADQLKLPHAVRELCSLQKGLVVVTGPTGSGKSTTLAAMIDLINKTRTDHIITIEDPVEFVHEPQRCLVNQREVHTHTESFSAALRAALREDPDIVLVGEMRDLETVAIAIETAETGHLVFGTLHTNTAQSTVDRIIDQFPAERQSQVRVMLSESLRGVIAQTLCKKVGGGRVAALEILLVVPAIANLIREGKTFQIGSFLQTGKSIGMQTLNDALLGLVREGVVDPAEALRRAVQRGELKTALERAGYKLDG
jgi:twitching motility protein PilT